MVKELRTSGMREKKSYSVFDMKYLWTIFTTHKKWFALSVVLCLFLAVAYVYFTRPAYNIVGKMLLIDRRQGSSSNISAANAALLSQLPSSLSSSLNLGRSLGSENDRQKESLYAYWSAFVLSDFSVALGIVSTSSH